jgi:hypothetical protein
VTATRHIASPDDEIGAVINARSNVRVSFETGRSAGPVRPPVIR